MSNSNNQYNPADYSYAYASGNPGAAQQQQLASASTGQQAALGQQQYYASLPYDYVGAGLANAGQQGQAFLSSGDYSGTQGFDAAAGTSYGQLCG